MTADEYKDKLNKFISDIETVRDGHKFESAMIPNHATDRCAFDAWRMHENKAAAYDFVIRKLRRTFNIVSNEKETK